MNKNSAEIVSREMLDIAARLNSSVALLVEHLSQEDLQIYKGVVAELMGSILIEFLNPIYKTHPDLKPPELD
jgi:hypothetical protein